MPDGRDLAEIVRPDLEARGWPVFEVSAATREGLQELTYAMAEARGRAPGRAAGRSRPGSCCARWPSTTPASPSSRSADGAFVVRGAEPERWVRQTNFDNDEAVGYLADRLARLGVEDAAGQGRRASPAAWSASASASSTGSRPSTPAWTTRPGQRGTDYRLEETSNRPRRGRAAGRPQGPPPPVRGAVRLRRRPARHRRTARRRRSDRIDAPPDADAPTDPHEA